MLTYTITTHAGESLKLYLREKADGSYVLGRLNGSSKIHEIPMNITKESTLNDIETIMENAAAMDISMWRLYDEVMASDT